VELVQDDCSVSADHAEAMAQGLASLNADDVRVLATANFVETVAEVTGNSSYTADRGGGVAAARTVTGAGGSVVIVNYDEVASRSRADVQRILAHEGGHVRIDARGTEETSGCCGFPKFPTVDHWNSPGDERCGGPGMSLRGCQVAAS